MRRIGGFIFTILCCLSFDAIALSLDVTQSIQISKSGLIYNRNNKTFNTTLSIKNTSNTKINGPIIAAVIVSDPANISVNNATGTSSNGFPTININPPSGQLDSGSIINSIPLSFKNPSQKSFTYTLTFSGQLTNDVYLSQFTIYSAARQGQLNGLNNVNVGIIGDSLSVGQFAFSSNSGLPWYYGGSASYSLAALLANEKAGNDDNTWGGAQCGENSVYNETLFDSRLQQGSGNPWQTWQLGVKVIAAGFDYASSGIGAPLSFTPNNPWDSVDIYWIQNTGYGSMSIQANGISKTLNSNAPLGLASSTLSKNHGLDTLTITPTNENHIVGLNFYSKTKPSMNFLRLGCGNSTSVQWANSSMNWTSIPALQKIMSTNRVHLWVIQLGANDQIQVGLGGLSNYSSNIQTLINTLKFDPSKNPNGGDVVLMVSPPINTYGHASLATNSQYRQSIYSLALLNNLYVLDNYDYLVNFNVANSLGWYSVSNNIHESSIGYQAVINNIINLGILD